MSTKSRSQARTGTRNLQRGVSLVQLSFIIGIGAILLIFAATYGPRFFTKSKVQNEVSALADFRSNVVTLGSRVGLFTATNASREALINQNFWPMTMVSGTAPNRVVTNQWGGNYTVAVGTVVTAGDSIALTTTGIPAQACTELGTSLDGVANVITINGTNFQATGMTVSFGGTNTSSYTYISQGQITAVCPAWRKLQSARRRPLPSLRWTSPRFSPGLIFMPSITSPV